MELKKLMPDFIDDEITAGHGKLKINPVQKAGDFEVFNYLNADNKEVKIGDHIDYLDLFMRIAEQAYSKDKDNFSSYIISSNIGGGNIFWGRFSREDREKFQYGYIYLTRSLKNMAGGEIETKTGFWAELNLTDPKEEKFNRESPKVLKILKDDNRKAWLNIIENRLNFIKTDMYALALPKLHSWGFQIINAQGAPEPALNYVRSKVPKPRGAIRGKNKKN